MGNIVSNDNVTSKSVNRYYTILNGDEYKLRRTIKDQFKGTSKDTKLTEFINKWALGDYNITDERTGRSTGYINYDDGLIYNNCDKPDKFNKLLIKRGCCSNTTEIPISLPLYDSTTNTAAGDFRFVPVTIKIGDKIDDSTCNINGYYTGSDNHSLDATESCKGLYGFVVDTGKNDIDDCIFCKHVRNERIDMINAFSNDISNNNAGDYSESEYKKYTDAITSEHIDKTDIFNAYFEAYGRYHVDTTETRNAYQDCNCINSVINGLSLDPLTNYIKTATDNATGSKKPSAKIGLTPTNMAHYLDTKCGGQKTFLPSSVDKMDCIVVNNIQDVTVNNYSQFNINTTCPGSSNQPPTPPTKPPTPTPPTEPPTPSQPTSKSTSEPAPNVFLSKPVVIVSSVSIVVLIMIFLIKHFHLFLI